MSIQINNVLLTGANGFLGNSIRVYFKDIKLHVISLGKSHKNDIVCNLGDDIPNISNPLDIIIHTAGKAHSVPKSPEEEKEFYDVNYQGTVNLCRAIDKLENKPKAFIFISTIAVYGLDTGTGITEESPLLGSSPYAKSKIQAEEYLQKWTKENNITLGILRLPIIAGPNPPGNLGAMINGIKSGRYLSIGDASARKSIVWAEDIAKIIPRLSEIGGIYNLTDGDNPSFGELEQEISKNLGKNKPMKVPLWAATVLAKIGDLIGEKSPINSYKLNKIKSTLTFSDVKARNNLDWKPSKVSTKIPKITQN